MILRLFAHITYNKPMYLDGEESECRRREAAVDEAREGKAALAWFNAATAALKYLATRQNAKHDTQASLTAGY
jgi:hypothetical protein